MLEKRVANKLGLPLTRKKQPQFSTLDEKSGILTSFDNYMTQKNADKPNLFNHKFALQIYSAKQLEEILSRMVLEFWSGARLMDQSFVSNEVQQF